MSLDLYAAYEREHGERLEDRARAQWAERADLVGLAYVLDAEGRVAVQSFVSRPTLPGHEPTLDAQGRPRGLYTGEMRACARDQRYARPFRGGVSGGGAPDGLTGTLGAVVRGVPGAPDAGRRYVLTCAHVLCEAVDPAPGGLVVQPASSDDPSEAGNEVGAFARAAPWTEPVNDADAAIAELRAGTMRAGIVGVGRVPSWRRRADVPIGLPVLKSGRTDPVLREGEVVSNQGVFRWPMPGGVRAVFRNVIVTTRLCDEGDSGAVLVARDDHSAIGVVCATTDRHSFIISMEAVEATLGVVVAARVWTA